MKNNKLFSPILFLMGILFGSILQTVSWAGQFITEDPVPTEYEHVEFNPYIFETKVKAWSTFDAPAAEIDIGLLPELQGHLIMTVTRFSPSNGSPVYGYGDMEIGTKYRFNHETETMPQIAFYPKVTLPSGDVNSGLGLGEATESLPIWIQKNWGSWKVSGGGGYTFSQASQSFNYAFGGVLFQREFTKSFTLGGEFYAQGASYPDYGSTLLFTFGGNYNFTPNIALLFSAGHSIAGAKTLTGYLGIDFTWGPP